MPVPMSGSQSDDLIDLLDQVTVSSTPQPHPLVALLESVDTIQQIEAEFESKIGTQEDEDRREEENRVEKEAGGVPTDARPLPSWMKEKKEEDEVSVMLLKLTG